MPPKNSKDNLRKKNAPVNSRSLPSPSADIPQFRNVFTIKTATTLRDIQNLAPGTKLVVKNLPKSYGTPFYHFLKHVPAHITELTIKLNKSGKQNLEICKIQEAFSDRSSSVQQKTIPQTTANPATNTYASINAALGKRTRVPDEVTAQNKVHLIETGQEFHVKEDTLVGGIHNLPPEISQITINAIPKNQGFFCYHYLSFIPDSVKKIIIPVSITNDNNIYSQVIENIPRLEDREIITEQTLPARQSVQETKAIEISADNQQDSPIYRSNRNL